MNLIVFASSFVVLFHIFFGRVDGFDQHYPDLKTGIVQFLILGRIDIIGFQQKFKPVTGFIGFFQGDLQLGNEIRFTVCILRFVNICADAGPGTADLIGNNCFMPAFQHFDQIEDLDGEIDRYNVRKGLSGILKSPLFFCDNIILDLENVKVLPFSSHKLSGEAAQKKTQHDPYSRREPTSQVSAANVFTSDRRERLHKQGFT